MPIDHIFSCQDISISNSELALKIAELEAWLGKQGSACLDMESNLERRRSAILQIDNLRKIMISRRATSKMMDAQNAVGEIK